MAQSSILPVIIKGQYQGGDAFAQLVADAKRSGSQAKQAFEQDFAEIGRIAKRATDRGPNSVGAVDLGVGEFQRAAAEATAYRTSLEAIGRTATQLAVKTGDTSTATRSYLAALNAQTVEAREAERTALAQVTTYGRLQSALNANEGAVDRLAASYRALEQARNADNIAAAAAEVRNRRFTEFQQSQGIGPDADPNNSARASAAVFEEQARAAAVYANNLELVKRAIDPTRVAQQQLDAELARADAALERADISMKEYGVAVNRAADNYQSLVAGARLGTTAFGAVTNSTRAWRVASIQAGQQFQDVIISLQAGQRASTVFAQQLPQLAFALTGVGGKVGTVARVLAGPGGAALLGAMVILGPVIGDLIGDMFDLGDETDKAARSSRTFTEVLNDQTSSQKELTKAAKDYADQLEKNRQTTLEQIQIDAAAIKRSYERAAALREELAAQLKLNQERERAALSNIDNPELAGPAAAGAALQARAIESRIAENDKALAGLRRDADELVIKTAGYIADLQTDPEKQIKEGFDVLRQEARKTIKPIEELTARLATLNKQEKAALDALHASTTAGNRQFGREIDLAQASSIARAAGFRITSGFRTRAEQQRLYDTVRTPQNPVALPGTSAHERGNALDIAFGPGVSPASIRKAFADEGVKLTKLLTETGHYHIEFSTKGADKAQRDAQRLADFGDRAAESIARISERFDDQPRIIDAAASATRQLDAIIADLFDRKPEGFKELVAAAQEAKDVVANGLLQPFREMTKETERRAQIDELLIQGRKDEAEILSRQFDLEEKLGSQEDLRLKIQDLITAGRGDDAAIFEKVLDAYPQMIAGIRQTVIEERQRTRELEKQNELREREAQLIRDTRDNIRGALQDLARGGGGNAIVAALKRQFDLVLTKVVDDLFEGIFGDIFRDAEEKALNKSVTARQEETAAVNTARKALDEFSASVLKAASVVANPANDNGGTTFDGSVITVTAKKSAKKSFKDAVNGALKDVLGEDAYSQLSAAFQTIAQGVAIGRIASGVGDALGIKQSKLGASIGGAIGSAVAGPVGAVVGGFLGGTIGGAFKSTPRASSTIGVGADGRLQVVSTRGNSASRREASSGAAGEAIDTLDRIAEALGATIDASLGSVSIGVRKGNYRVDTSGRGITKTSKGAIDFGEDSAAAIRAATLDLIQDGVLQGLRDSTQRLLQQAKDLDSGIQKALDFESVFDRLKAFKDPVGAAIDGVDKEFTRLIRIFEEAGASAEEWAQLEELYGLERADAIKQATEAATSTLRDFISDLETGDNGLSLRSRLASAQAAYNPFAEAIRNGETVDYGDFTDAAQTLLSISRQLYGSQTEYFDTFNEVLGLSKQALADQQDVISIADGQDTPFTNRDSVDTVPVVTAVNDQSQLLLTQSNMTNEWLEKIYNAVAANNNSGSAAPTGTYF